MSAFLTGTSLREFERPFDREDPEWVPSPGVSTYVPSGGATRLDPQSTSLQAPLGTSRFAGMTMDELLREANSPRRDESSEIWDAAGNLAGASASAYTGAMDALLLLAEGVNVEDPPSAGVYRWAEVTPPDPREIARRRAQSAPLVRRPTMGLSGYEDRFASLEVIARGDGGSVEMFNSSYRKGRHAVNTNFIVQSITTQKVSSAQVVRTFGDWYLSVVGENPEMIEVRGALFEARNFPWLAEWRMNFDRYLRAEQCVLRRAMVYLTIDDTMYVGYMTATQTARSADVAWELVPFTFTMVVRDVVDVRAVTLFPDTEMPPDTVVTEGASSYINGLRLTDIVDGADGLYSPHYTEQMEIVAGAVSAKSHTTAPVLEFEGRLDEAVFRNDLDALLASARSINARAGRAVVDLQQLRNEYMAGRQAELSSLGYNSPEALQQFGFPSRYQGEVSAQRARVQEEYRGHLENAYAAAGNAIDSVTWM